MSLRQFSLTDFRNLHSATLDFHPSINLLYGENGSGKTSLLEAIHVNCQARSFRQRQLKKCIKHGSDRFLLFGKFDTHKVGISRSENTQEIRVNGESIGRQSELVRLSPVKVFNAESFELLTGPPEVRRKYLDWCLFHVEHSYADHWLKYRHALKQRNKLLKDRRDLHLLDYWDSYLVGPSQALCDLRKEYCDRISALMVKDLSGLFGDLEITVEYEVGWDNSIDLLEAMKNGKQKDIRNGFTGQGIHRDNMVILSKGRPVKDVLSRGQLKRLTIVLLIAALKLVSKPQEHRIILLIDDLTAEMDKSSEDTVYSALSDIDLQVFITNITEGIPEPIKGKDFKMFHVEHGMIKPQKIR